MVTHGDITQKNKVAEFVEQRIKRDLDSKFSATLDFARFRFLCLQEHLGPISSESLLSVF